MRLTVIGCSGSFPGPDAPASCYLVEQDDAAGRTWRILLDLGNGALGSLQRYADPLAVDAVLLTHLHADHCLDLCGYYVLRKYHPSGPQDPIPVHGPVGTAERMARAYDLPATPGMTEVFDFVDLSDREPFDIGPFTVDPIRVNHPVDAFALRVTAGGATLAYSGDSGPCDTLVQAAAGVNLLLAEAAFEEGTDNPPDLHLTGADCGRLAREAGVGRLVITHVPPWHDPQVALSDARAHWPGECELARVGATFDLG